MVSKGVVLIFSTLNSVFLPFWISLPIHELPLSPLGVSTIRSDVMLPACPRPWCFMRLGASTDYTLNLIQGKIYTLRISVTNRINMVSYK